MKNMNGFRFSSTFAQHAFTNRLKAFTAHNPQQNEITKKFHENPEIFKYREERSSKMI
jgi:hypothetical protein